MVFWRSGGPRRVAEGRRRRKVWLRADSVEGSDGQSLLDWVEQQEKSLALVEATRHNGYKIASGGHCLGVFVSLIVVVSALCIRRPG